MSDDNTATENAEAEQGNPVDDTASLGDAGKQALDRMKAERNAAKQQAAALQAQLDELNRANESAIEKATREANEAREAATKAAAEAARFRVAAKHGLSDEDADLFLTGSDAETLERQAAALIARTPSGPKPDPSQGAKGTGGAKTPAESFSDFFRNQLT